MTKFLIGADPELFLQNTKGILVSAVGKIGGTKHEPLPISKDGHCIQEDNVSVEFNIPPSDSRTAFVSHINFVLEHLEVRAKELGLVFATGIASASFPEQELMTPEAQTFGCEPDFNAYTLEPNPRPMCDDETLRSCGGHIHIGTEFNPIAVVKAMDYFVGIPAVLMDADMKRRLLYGKAGAFRPKSYGVEYRTLSNFWLWKDSYKEWVYEQTQMAIDAVASGDPQYIIGEAAIVNTINTGDKNAARKLAQLDSRIRSI